ncbi:S-layer homology domain-containing protein [Paenibacillus sp.]|uniref:S-layer homology domain-containing protein n=1 Tax=Paenibacillus sp. TaxID=58172 RepID=UPI002D632BF6|nr:S-layer homology domain-containing protein [Paenibacillus sp.]HZG87372.1 S-layer homology domain-containing protein [Paenibacillus sp.]
MQRLKLPWLQIALVMTLLTGLLPMGTASAALVVTITNLYVEDTPGNNPPASDGNIFTVTTRTIDVDVTLQDVTPAQKASMQVEIYNTVTKQATTVRANPQPVGTSSVLHTIRAVPLTEGLNMITVLLEGNRFGPGWVYSSSVATISDLKVNNVAFSGNRIFPANPQLNSLAVITGAAPNATTLSAYLNGSSTEIVAGVDQTGGFTLTGDLEGRSTSVDMQLKPGDNLITFVAANSTRTYRLDRTLVYDNGGPFAFSMIVNDTGTPAGDKTLLLGPTVTSTSVALTGKIKVNLDASNNLQYNTLTVLGRTFTLDMDNTNDGQATNNLPINADWTPVGGNYVVFDFSDDVAFDLNQGGTGRNRTIDFAFSAGGPAVTGSTFGVTYQDPAAPYVDYAERSLGNGSVYVRMGESPSLTQVNEHPITFRVRVSANTNRVDMKRGNTVLQSDTSIVGGVAEFTFTGTGASVLPLGDYDISFSPFTGPGPTEYAANGKSYSLSVSAAPYVIFQNLYDAQTLTGADFPKTVNVRMANIPQGTNQLDIVLNDIVVASGVTTSGNIFSFQLTAPVVSAATERRMKEGSNTLKVIVYSDTTKTTRVTEQTLNLFVATVPIPSFVSMTPVETAGRDDYKTTNVANTYATNESTVQFSGRVRNATAMNIEVVGGPDAGTSSMAVPDNADFTTAVFDLAPMGNTTFIFSITNGSGIQVFYTVTIRREVVPYVLVLPIFAKNADGIDQANINSNFVELIIEAEGSDRIVFNKEDAVETAEDTYTYEVRNLKSGKNTVKFTIYRGTEQIQAQVIVNNVNTTAEGAMYKAPIGKKVEAFNKQLSLTFPNNAQLRRNDPDAANQFITSERQILIGIANDTDGRLDKIRHPVPDPAAISRLGSTERERFSAASPMFWIDAGFIQENTNDYEDAMRGSGQQPYDGTRFYNRNPEDQVVPTAAGTLTLQYNRNIRNDGWKYVTVFHYDAQEDAYGNLVWGWHNVGGKVDSNRNTITVPFQRFGYYQVMYMDQSFNDVITHEWARDELDILYSKGMMMNKENSWFRPFDVMTRGEFATLLVKAFDIPLNYGGGLTFTDVPMVDLLNFRIYNYKYIETAARAGIIRGKENGRFEPNGSITREDAAVMIARAANLKLDTDQTKLLKDLQKEFTDANEINQYSRASVAAVVDEGYIVGLENVTLQGQRKPTYRFEPKTTFTRDQAAAVIIRIMKSLGKIPK